MARGRIIDRELYSHVDLGDMSIECRYLYQGLIVWADDEGRLKAHPKYLKIKIFPYDKITETNIKSMVDHLATNGFIKLYLADGNIYLEHVKWSQWQTIRKDRFHPSDCPSPTEETILVNQPSPNDLPLVYQVPPEPNLTKPNLTHHFETFWKAYPKKKNKGDAEKAWRAIDPQNEIFSRIIEAIDFQKETNSWKDDGGKYIPYPASWLRAKAWEDEIEKGEPTWKDRLADQIKEKELKK